VGVVAGLWAAAVKAVPSVEAVGAAAGAVKVMVARAASVRAGDSAVVEPAVLA
jgi:hypothetical protein